MVVMIICLAQLLPAGQNAATPIQSMNTSHGEFHEVQRFLDNLKTIGDIETLYQALCELDAIECDDFIMSFASTFGFKFEPADARDWLSSFVLSISDSDLRSCWRMSRLSHLNDWAAFIALEREMKITIPEETLIGNPWHLDVADEENARPSKLYMRLVNFFLRRGASIS